MRGSARPGLVMLISWVCLAVIVAGSAGAAVVAGDTLVTSGSNPSPFSQNKQNEPAVAVDQAHPGVLAAGSNDNIDLEACNAGDPTTCPFTQGVGVSGVYFSFDGGQSWKQPTYGGWTARDCFGPAACQPHTGAIGTMPNYVEAGLVSDGDPTVAFGPRPDSRGVFGYANGSRLYYGNLTSNFSSVRSETAFNGFEDLAVSHTDNVAAAAAGANAAWSAPALVGKQNSALFNDKISIWADNTASSHFFGHVYVCNTSFRGQEKGNAAPEPILFYSSTDGGTTWSNPVQLSSATNNSQTGGRQDCAIRTDSQGTVFVYWDGFAGNTGTGAIFQARSFDGGQHFEHPRTIATYVPCGIFDPANGTASFDGIAGARTGSEPIADIANGAPSGSDATNEIVLTYCDGKTPTDTSPGLNERAVVIYSTDRGNTFLSVGNAADASDRPDFPAIAISPNGTNAWLTYDAFLQPWQSTTANPRLMQGVVRHAAITAGVPVAWSDVHRAPIGDARGSSTNSLASGFLGDYNYSTATRTNGIAVWNDVRNAADCPAIDAYREALVGGPPAPRPSPNTDCPATFGNTDIWGGSFTNP
jgi:hypothetical protein